MRAMIVSLGLHVLVLGALAPYHASETGETTTELPLRAELRSLPVPAVRDAPTVSRHAVSRAPSISAPTPKKSPPASIRAPDQSVSQQGAIVAVPKPAEAPSVSPLRVESTLGSSGKDKIGELNTAATSVALPEPAASSGVDADGIRHFRLALASEARRFRSYPERARRAGLSGTTEVRVSIESGSGARSAALSRSSGHVSLDEMALEMLRKAAQRAELPVSLRGQNFAVLLPVVFEVEE